jgi:glycosyltransferase involved in cell wall biosynthesis
MARMLKVLLINQEKVPHYRVPIYNYLSEYLKKQGCALTVVSKGTQDGSPHLVQFDHKTIPLSFLPLARLILQATPDVIIYWVRLRHLYLFPILILAKILRIKTIYWGHGTDLGGQKALWLKQFANSIEYSMSDALVLYAEHLLKHLNTKFHRKTFIANNTLCFNGFESTALDKASCLSKYNITTPKNIICCGRMQKRKRLEHLFDAFKMLNRRDTGLILVGPDTDGTLREVHDKNIHVLGPIYGDELLNLLSASDVFCLPGAVGLSIVDAFYCGLPLVTEDGDESPEIMYLKDGINGFVVPKSDRCQLSARLRQLIEDDALRKQFSIAARDEIMTNGHIDKMCQGFSEAIHFVRAGLPSKSVEHQNAVLY